MATTARPNKTAVYETLSEKMRFIIDCFATYMSQTRIEKAVREKYGEDESVKYKTLGGYKSQYIKSIEKRRKELMDEIPIMNPAARFRMAQELYDMSIEGTPRFNKQGGYDSCSRPEDCRCCC